MRLRVCCSCCWRSRSARPRQEAAALGEEPAARRAGAVSRELRGVPRHRQAQQSKKLGPSFYQLFKRDKMPIAAMKPNRDYIKVRVKFGGPIMPAFRQWLSEREIDTLIDYIASK